MYGRTANNSYTKLYHIVLLLSLSVHNIILFSACENIIRGRAAVGLKVPAALMYTRILFYVLEIMKSLILELIICLRRTYNNNIVQRTLRAFV